MCSNYTISQSHYRACFITTACSCQAKIKKNSITGHLTDRLIDRSLFTLDSCVCDDGFYLVLGISSLCWWTSLRRCRLKRWEDNSNSRAVCCTHGCHRCSEMDTVGPTRGLPTHSFISSHAASSYSFMYSPQLCLSVHLFDYQLLLFYSFSDTLRNDWS